MKTRRARIAELIAAGPSTPSGIARALDLNVKVVLDDLKHISRSKKYGKLMVQPARCLKCGYVFRAEIKVPKKCPSCHSSWIEEPRFSLVPEE
uniref:Predicted transcriptional regulator containing an HTH domain fused to a Zn ribbon n=1 Tax=uncultured euryarchaeote Alv-FOS1 TaxID=337892 RepID=Q3SAC0_9EURY|nr:predicted transcriptional regulator containing an HTH domain fused to a Zn ribbon [uncultured euryarchaeote Alv-FOS1]